MYVAASTENAVACDRSTSARAAHYSGAHPRLDPPLTCSGTSVAYVAVVGKEQQRRIRAGRDRQQYSRPNARRVRRIEHPRRLAVRVGDGLLYELRRIQRAAADGSYGRDERHAMPEATLENGRRYGLIHGRALGRRPAHEEQAYGVEAACADATYELKILLHGNGEAYLLLNEG